MSVFDQIGKISTNHQFSAGFAKLKNFCPNLTKLNLNQTYLKLKCRAHSSIIYRDFYMQLVVSYIHKHGDAYSAFL